MLFEYRTGQEIQIGDTIEYWRKSRYNHPGMWVEGIVNKITMQAASKWKYDKYVPYVRKSIQVLVKTEQHYRPTPVTLTAIDRIIPIGCY